jgi:hypothetical protein
MHIKLPYAYAMLGRRGKLGRTVHGSGVVERDVPEISSQVAPLVAEWTDDEGQQRSRGLWGGSRYSRVSCRVFDGAHYVQLPGPLHTNMFAKDRLFCSGLCIDSLVKLMKMTSGKDDTKILEQLYIGELPTIGNFGKPLDRVVTSDETFRQIAARALLNSMVFIDGVAWTRCHEPKLRATRAHGGEATIFVELEFDNELSKPGYGNHVRSKWHDTDLFFNLNAHEDAMDFLTSVGVVQSPSGRGVQQVVVHSPEMFAFDDHRARLRAIARDLAENLRPNVGTMADATARDWMALRDMLHRNSANDNQALYDTISRLVPEVGVKDDADRLRAELALAREIDDRKHAGQPNGANARQLTPR